MAKTKGNGCGWLRRRSGKVYYFRLNAEGKEKAKLVGPAELSDNKAWKLVRDLDLDKQIQQPESQKLTFAEVAQAFLEWGKNFGDNYGEPLADSTRKVHRHIIDHYLVPEFGNRVATELTSYDVQHWVEGLTSLHTKTRSKMKSLLGTVYRWAASPSGLKGFPKDNPVDGVKCSSKGKKKWKPKTSSADETLAVMSFLPLCERTLLLLIAVTGLRQSEALALRWKDLDAKNKHINVTKAWVDGVMQGTKTESSDEPVAYHPLLAAAMEAWRAESMYATDSDYVFASVKCEGRIPRSGSIMTADYLRPAAEKAGLIEASEKRFGWHNFRHSMSTRMAEMGEDPKLIQSAMRHSKYDMTLHYTHASAQRRVEAQGRLLQGLLPAITGLNTGLGDVSQQGES